MGGATRTRERLALGLLATIAVATLIIPPFTRGPIDLCLFKGLLGTPCPGCGMTRAFLLMGHGRVAEAVSFNPLSPAAYLLLWGLVAAGVARAARFSRGRRKSPPA
jgi:hypothetical protein